MVLFLFFFIDYIFLFIYNFIKMYPYVFLFMLNFKKSLLLSLFVCSYTVYAMDVELLPSHEKKSLCSLDAAASSADLLFSFGGVDDDKVLDAVIADRIDKHDKMLSFLENSDLSFQEKVNGYWDFSGVSEDIRDTRIFSDDNNLKNTMLGIIEGVHGDRIKYLILRDSLDYIKRISTEDIEVINNFYSQILCMLRFEMKTIVLNSIRQGVKLDDNINETNYYKILCKILTKKCDDRYAYLSPVSDISVEGRDRTVSFRFDRIGHDLLKQSRQAFEVIYENRLFQACVIMNGTSAISFSTEKASLFRNKIAEIIKKRDDIISIFQILNQKQSSQLYHPNGLIAISSDMSPFVIADYWVTSKKRELEGVTEEMRELACEFNAYIFSKKQQYIKKYGTRIDEFFREIEEKWPDLLQRKAKEKTVLPKRSEAENQARDESFLVGHALPQEVKKPTAKLLKVKREKIRPSLSISPEIADSKPIANLAAIGTDISEDLKKSDEKELKASLLVKKEVNVTEDDHTVKDSALNIALKVEDSQQGLVQSNFIQGISSNILCPDKKAYPSWIQSLLRDNHPSYRDMMFSFKNFVRDHDLVGSFQQEGHKGVLALKSPVSEQVHAETFHIPHKTVEEKSWPSWRHALKDLLFKANII